MNENPFKKLLPGLTKKPAMIPKDVARVTNLSDEDKVLIRRIGLTFSQLRQTLTQETQILSDRMNTYHQINRSLNHPIVASALELYADYCCLTADTKIPLLDGRTLAIKEVLEESRQGKENWVYSCDYNGKPQPAKILAAIEQPKQGDVLRIWLDNGKYVEATVNHRFIRRDGTLCRADELSIGDSLMPFHRSSTENGYERVWNVPKKNWDSTYKMVAQDVYKVDLVQLNKGKSVVKAKGTHLVVHHIDFNKENNNPSNLKVMTVQEHFKLHGIALKERWQDPLWRDMMIQKNIESHNSPDYKGTEGNLKAWSRPDAEQRREELRERARNRIKSPEEIAKIKANNASPEFRRIAKESHNTEEYKAYMYENNWHNDDVNRKRSKGIKAAYAAQTEKERQRKPRETRICAAPGCNNTFEVIVGEHSEDRLCCGRSCGMKCSWIRRKELASSNNHKIVKIESIGKHTVYDISVSGSKLFGIDVGIYVHNTNFSQLHNKSAWITSESPKYQKELTKLLDHIGMEEKIFDWACSVGSFGDLFVKINGVPGHGVVSIDDDENPISTGRVDYQGILVGFYKTMLSTQAAATKSKLLPPWDYVHFRLLGAKRKRPMTGDPLHNEFRTMHLMAGMDTRQVSSRYGTSLLLNALPTYRRLRLCEDSLLLARTTRGILRYIWKLKVDGQNLEAVGEMVDQIASTLKRARALDTSSENPNYDSKFNPLSAIEDLFIPVWGDTGDLTYDEIGGKADIRWIVDIEDLRNQLACALRCPLSLLGGYVQEASGALGSEAIEKLDIRFARSARRLQRSLINGITRICQIHLAYMNMDPDPNLFQVNMSETSTAEEESLKASLEGGVDIVDKMIATYKEVVGEDRLDTIKLANYLNQKILKLEDFDMEQFTKSPSAVVEGKEEKEEKPKLADPVFNLDITTYLPVAITEENKKNFNSWLALERHQGTWQKKFGETYVKETQEGESPSTGEQLALW